jgi:hypothetical protein
MPSRSPAADTPSNLRPAASQASSSNQAHVWIELPRQFDKMRGLWADLDQGSGPASHRRAAEPEYQLAAANLAADVFDMLRSEAPDPPCPASSLPATPPPHRRAFGRGVTRSQRPSPRQHAGAPGTSDHGVTTQTEALRRVPHTCHTPGCQPRTPPARAIHVSCAGRSAAHRRYSRTLASR